MIVSLPPPVACALAGVAAALGFLAIEFLPYPNEHKSKDNVCNGENDEVEVHTPVAVFFKNAKAAFITAKRKLAFMIGINPLRREEVDAECELKHSTNCQNDLLRHLMAPHVGWSATQSTP